MSHPNELHETILALRTAQARTQVITTVADSPAASKSNFSRRSFEKYAAKIRKIRIDWSEPAGIPSTAPVCELCGGAGALPLNPEAQIDSPDFGKVESCPGESHHPERVKYLGRLGNLSAADLEINLYKLPPYHTDKMVQYAGLRSPRAMSNREMLSHFKAIAENPSAHPLTYVLGPNGNGKTTAAIGLVNALNQSRHGPAVYITLVELLAYIKSAYGDTGDSKDTAECRYQKLAAAKVVVIDEFETGSGQVRLTEDNLTWLSRWFADRYRQAMSRRSTTVIISNNHPNTLELPAILSRLKDFKRIVCTAPDFRGRKDSHETQ